MLVETPQFSAAKPLFSVVVATLGRGRELLRLLDSLEEQAGVDVEVVIVDQNDDDRVTHALAGRDWRFPINVIRTPGRPGVCRARNVGWLLTRGDCVVFADDDCWYPPGLFSSAWSRLEASGAAIVTGRAADRSGRSINGRFEAESQFICRANIWSTSIEWMIFFRRAVLQIIGGFDEMIGPGSGTPWGANEGQDILLRALSHGVPALYDPSLFGFHPEIDLTAPGRDGLDKALAYARGMGFVLRRHHFGATSAAYWVARPALAFAVHAMLGRRGRARYYARVARGRLEGWRDAARLGRSMALQARAVAER
jgi:glycosyltransferase involved in cell wall biosynthesis